MSVTTCPPCVPGAILNRLGRGRVRLEHRYRDFSSERCDGERDVDARHDVDAIALEPWVLFDVDVDVQVSCTVRPGQPLTGNAKALARVDSGGKRDRDRARLLDEPVPRARLAWRLDEHAATAALRTRSREHHEAARIGDLTRATTRSAWLGTRTLRRSIASAVIATRGSLDVDLALAPERRIDEGDSLLNSEITAAPLRTSAETEPAARKHLGEEVLHVGQDVTDAASAHPTALEAGMPEAVVDGAFLLVRKDLVGLVGGLELPLRFAVSLVAVGVVLEGLALVSTTNFLGWAFARHP